MTNSVRVTLFLLANVNRLAIVTLRTVAVDPPVHETTSGAAYARCIRFLPPLIWVTLANFGHIDFGKFYSDFFATFSESNFGKLYITGFLDVCSLLL